MPDATARHETRELQQLVEATAPNGTRQVQTDTGVKEIAAVPRVANTGEVVNRCITCSMSQPESMQIHEPIQLDNTQSALRVDTPKGISPPLRGKQQRRSTMPAHLPTDPPTNNRRSKVRVAKALAAPPAQNTILCKHVSTITKPTQKLRQLTNRIQRIENKANKSMSVMDKDTVKMLNYHQLMWYLGYKQPSSKSSANKLRQLANGVDERIKWGFHIQ